MSKEEEEEIVFVRKSSGLIRMIGLFTVMVFGVNYTIADGIYNFTMWQTYKNPGAFYPFSLVLGAIILCFSAFSITMLTVAMPRTSSDYVAVSRVVHPFLGYMEAFMNIGCHLFIVGALSYFMTWYFGSFLIQTGLALGVSGWVEMGAWLSTNVWVGVAVGTLFCIWAGLVNLFGIGSTKWTINILFGVALIAGIVTAGAGIWGTTLSLDKVQSLWDSTYGSGAWQEIIDIAKDAGWSEYTNGGVYGWPGTWTWAATASAMVPAAYAFWGFEYGNYVAGEVSEPRKSFIWGTLGAIILILVYYLLISVPTLSAYGPFTSYYNYVMFGGHGVDNVSINPVQTPTLAVMLASLVSSVAPWAAIVITLGIFLFVLNGLPVYMIIPSRIMLSLSFDRFFPEKLSEVNEKWHTPHWAVLVSIILAVISVILTAITPWFYMVSVIFITMIRWWLGSLAALILPKSRPDLYERVDYEVGGIPLVSILGGLGVVTMGWLLYHGFLATISSPVSAWYVFAWFLGSVLFYAFYYWRNKRRGIDPKDIFGEVPPV
ncbi:MAG: APC family permease [Candidatus Korarchaeota archaeon]|nr:APC family permease [Candidatus Korarchaeota archaeon]NIU83743.1 amino acid permease [Candidatus Thorarchaeota archaeon]NIW15696.1 amino acid permease [Candidatus Thorarchaeota archaeon]NIW52060.1 amino acid permease [Candidatus Korarchaeota archaeon]